MRITIAILEEKVKYLNMISKNTYTLYQAYGKVRLDKVTEHGGQSAVSAFGTKANIANIIDAIEVYAKFEEAKNS